IALTIILYRMSMAKKSNELKSLGGIKEKYKEFISHFDDFDIHNKPTELLNKSNGYEIGWAEGTTIFKLSLYEIYDNLHIEFKMMYNKQYLKRRGINLNNLPKIDEKITWKFDNKSNQTEMAYIVLQDINSVIDSM